MTSERRMLSTDKRAPLTACWGLLACNLIKVMAAWCLLANISVMGTATAVSTAFNETDSEAKMNRIGALLSYLDVDNELLVAAATALLMILVSELGDKSFFIAAVLAMRHSRLVVFLAALLALEVMALISALLGNFITQFVPRRFIFYASALLFALFGLKMLYEAFYMPDEGPAGQAEQGAGQRSDPLVSESGAGVPVASVFAKTFLLMFCGEWGDRSQIGILILGARQNVVGTIVGCTLGNAICTAMAVVGGRFVAQKISIRLIHFTGALFFLGFCLLDVISFFFFT